MPKKIDLWKERHQPEILLWQPCDNCLPDFTIYSKLEEWLRNFRTNNESRIFYNDKSNGTFALSVRSLPRIKSAIIIDNPMTGSLNKHLKNLTNVKTPLLVCDRALPKLAENKITPKYVGNVDSSYLCTSFFDRPEVKPLMTKTTAIFATTAFPLTIRAWQGKRAFFTPPLGQPLTETLAALSGTVIMNTGGNIATTLWILAANLEAKNIGILGIDNGYYHLEETEYPNAQHSAHETPYGVIFQDLVYEKYADWHFEIIEEAKKRFGVTTYNLNKGGAMYGHGIIDMSLEEFDEKFA